MKNNIKKIMSFVLAAVMLTFAGCSGENGDTVETSEKPKTTKVTTAAVTEPETEPEEETRPPIYFAKDPLAISLKAPHAFVYDMNKKEFLYLSGEGEMIYPASTTKLLTIIYALTLVEPDEVVTIGDELSLLGEHPSLALISRGQRLTVEMLIEGMLLPSGNDAAYSLSAAAGRKLANDPDLNGIDAARLFIAGMNEYARSIGMTGSNFTSPDGYFDENHYSTVEDMALISAMAAKNEIIAKYARKRTDKVTFASGEWIEWTNTNKLIDPSSGYYSPYATGLKTGSIENNYCLVASADIEGTQYVIGLFTETEPNARFADAILIINALEERIA